MMGPTSPYRQATLPVAPELRWRRLTFCFVLLLAATAVAALLAFGAASTVATEWNDDWKLDCKLGLFVGVPCLLLLLAPVLPYTIWVTRERSWLHPGILRNVAWTWRIATLVTAAAVVTFLAVNAHPAPPGHSWGTIFGLGGC